jgi:shikimate dehydrogenase
MKPTGATRLAAVIGDPIVHSLSPAIHNAAFLAAGLDWVFVAFTVPAGGAAGALDAVRALNLGGLSVTMPHKDDVAGRCDELTRDAAALRSVNTVVPLGDGRLLGDSTDGDGFLRALADDGVTVADRTAVVIGAGGAARAVALALARSGAQVKVAARRPDAADTAAALAEAITPIALDAVADAVEAADLVVNATPLGMGGEPPPFDTARLHAGQHVADLVYHPAETPLVAAARAVGASASNGLGMLVHQAALAFERWTGVPAPLDAMFAAVADQLG